MTIVGHESDVGYFYLGQSFPAIFFIADPSFGCFSQCGRKGSIALGSFSSRGSGRGLSADNYSLVFCQSSDWQIGGAALTLLAVLKPLFLARLQ